MQFNDVLKQSINQYKDIPLVQRQIEDYFERNKAARIYAELCEKNNWPLIFDHLTIRTYDIDKASEPYLSLGWKYDETIEYKNEGWWAKVFRNAPYAPFFIDQAYIGVKDHIITKWVDKFGDKSFHHIAVRLPQGLEIEEVISKLQLASIHFPGSITGGKGSRLRQVFSQAEIIDGTPFSVLELAQRDKNPQNGLIYEGFISEQADSLMKDSIL